MKNRDLNPNCLLVTLFPLLLSKWESDICCYLGYAASVSDHSDVVATDPCGY